MKVTNIASSSTNPTDSVFKLLLLLLILSTTPSIAQPLSKQIQKDPYHFAIYYDPFMITQKQLAFSFELFNKTGGIFINQSSLITHDSILENKNTVLFYKHNYITDVRFQKNLWDIFQYLWLYAAPYVEYKYTSTITNGENTNELNMFTAGMLIGLRKETKKRIVFNTYFGGGYSYSFVKLSKPELPPTSEKYMNIVPKFGFKIGYLL